MEIFDVRAQIWTYGKEMNKKINGPMFGVRMGEGALILGGQDNYNFYLLGRRNLGRDANYSGRATI